MNTLDTPRKEFSTELVHIPCGSILLTGQLSVPQGARGIVIFAHGCGSGYTSSRDDYFADELQKADFGTLLLDLLTESEQVEDFGTYRLRFDIDLLAGRLRNVTHWITRQPETRNLPVSYFGTSTGTAAALVAASRLADQIVAVVSRGGRPDLASSALPKVHSPTLLMVGEFDNAIWALNQSAYARLKCEKELEVISGANHLFDEPDIMERVARLAQAWFLLHLPETHYTAKQYGTHIS